MMLTRLRSECLTRDRKDQTLSEVSKCQSRKDGHGNLRQIMKDGMGPYGESMCIMPKCIPVRERDVEILDHELVSVTHTIMVASDPFYRLFLPGNLR